MSESESLVASNYNALEHHRSRSNSPFQSPNCLDLSYNDLEECETCLKIGMETKRIYDIHVILLTNNLLRSISPIIKCFQNIQTLDISVNQLKTLSIEISSLYNLRNLICKENLLDDNSLPKDFGTELNNLEVVNFSGNLFTQFPFQLLVIKSLKEIHLGSNKIHTLPKNYENLQHLEVLYLGGNNLKVIPSELSELKNLTLLNLCENKITSLPKRLAKLKRIKSLSLHGNNLTTLPIELVRLNLQELSLRNNPLIKRFVQEYSANVPSLLELCGRAVKSKNISYGINILPKDLAQYLDSAQCCLNPKCKGVYFKSKFEHVKFIDFCGKYRVPFMQYLCSSACDEKISNRMKFDNSSDSDDQDKLMKKILFG